MLPATLNPSGLLDTQTTYDAAGHVSSVQDGDGRLTLPVYDNAGRTIGSTTTYANATTLTSTVQLDPDGNVVSQVGFTQTVSQNGQVQTQAYTTTGYNAADWAVTSTDVLTSGLPLVTAYGYDAAGQERTQSIVSGTIPLTTTLDNEGRAISIVEGISGSGPYTTSYGYNPDDQPVSMTLPGSVQQGWGYDGDGRLITQTLAGPTGVSAPLSSTYGYSYTATGWTDGVTSTLSGITTTQLISHDAQGRLTAASGGGTSQSWSYDGNGNLLSAVITTTGGTTTTTYGYTQSITPNAALTVTTPGQPTTYYGYDQHGDTTSITNGGTLNTAIQYDSQARPITITLADGTQATLGYNADGLRASYSVSKGGLTTLSERFQYRGGELAQALVVSGTQSYTDTYVYAPSGSPLELLRTTLSGSTSRYWYQVDGRGNVVALTDATGNVVDRYSYDLWGALTSSSEQVPQQLRYGGYWWDAQLGWYWVSVRYYDPALERWLQPDPSEQDGVHTYVYVYDDPVDATDPTGLDSDPCNVFFFGYWCARNIRARFIQSVLQHQHLTIIVYVRPHSQQTQVSGALHGPDAARVVTSLAAGTLVLFGQKRIAPTFDPSHRFKGATIDEIAAKLRSGELSPDDIEIEAFVWGPEQQLVTLNNRSLAALSKAGFLPTNVKVVEYSSLSKGQLARLRQLPIEGADYTIPGTRIPVTPARNDPTILEMISLPGYEYELYPEGEVPIEDR